MSWFSIKRFEQPNCGDVVFRSYGNPVYQSRFVVKVISIDDRLEDFDMVSPDIVLSSKISSLGLVLK